MPGLAVPISSRKIVPPSACRNLPILSCGGAGERAGDVAEQLAFQQRFRQGAAGDFDERLVAAAAAAMDRAGDQRFAGAAFAGDQHGGPGVGDAVDHVEHRFMRGRGRRCCPGRSACRAGPEVLVFFDARGAG